MEKENLEIIVKSLVKQIEERIEKKPEIAIILGSGLSDVVDAIENKVTIPYAELEGMLNSSVEGHKNQFIVGDIYGKTVIAMQGRLHLYDGYTARQSCMPIYLFKELGVKTVIITNASGGIAEYCDQGDIMLLTDHINNTGTNSMIGGPVIDYGRQFVDMTEPYDVEYRNLAIQIAKENDISLKQGVYMQVTGPFYETKAYIRLAKTLGADAIGMSTVLEVEACAHCGLKVLGLSVITNKAAGLSAKIMDHHDVLLAGQNASKNLSFMITEFIKKM